MKDSVMSPFLPKPGSIWRHKLQYKDKNELLLILVLESSNKLIKVFRTDSYDQSTTIKEYYHYANRNIYYWKHDWELISSRTRSSGPE